MLFDFADPEAARAWRAVDDRVMGGVSQSTLTPHGGFARFAGVVSLAKGGGFASVRAEVPDALDLGGCSGLALRVRGDGRRYKLSLYPEPPPGAVRYQGAFDTADGVWQTRTLPFDALVPTFRGRRVAEAGPPDRSAVRAFSLLIADLQAGSFCLDLAWLKAVRF